MEKTNPKPRLLAVVGSTASGKTALAVALAKRLGGEIVSCDSMQIYRGMDIGTAKPDMAEREGIPMDDLFGLMKDRMSTYDSGDGLHLNSEGNAMVAAQVADIIRRYLSQD